MSGIVTQAYRIDTATDTGQESYFTNWGPHPFSGKLYAVLAGQLVAGPPEYLRVYMSADGGVTWTEMDSANAPERVANRPVSVYRLGDVLYMAYSIPTGTFDIFSEEFLGLGVQTFDLATETFGTAINSGPLGTGTADTGVGAGAIGAFSNGDCAVFGSNTTPGRYALLTGGIWSGPFMYTASTISSLTGNSLVVDPSDVIHFCYSVGGGTHFHQTLASDGTLGTAQLVQTDVNPDSTWGNGTILGTSMVIPFDDVVAVTPTRRQVCVYVSSDLSDAPTWTKVAVSSAFPGATPMMAFLNGTEVILFYLNDSLQLVYNVSSDGGLSWSSPGVFYDSATDPAPGQTTPGLRNFSATFISSGTYAAIASIYGPSEPITSSTTAYALGPAVAPTPSPVPTPSAAHSYIWSS